MNGKVKSALKSVIPNKVVWASQSEDVFDYLSEDFMRPVTRYVEKVLNETDLDVIVFNGELDLIVDIIGTTNWIYRLKWPGSEGWKNTHRSLLYVSDRREGYVKSYNRFIFYMIERAGHMVPSDNPKAALEMLRRVTNFSIY